MIARLCSQDGSLLFVADIDSLITLAATTRISATDWTFGRNAVAGWVDLMI
jgi:hypothetical protein